MAERKVENFLSDTVQGGGDAWDGLHLLGSDLCWIGSRAFFGKSCGEGKEVHHSCDSAASSDGSVYAFKSSESMKTNWPMRRPLFPVAVAGLVGTVMGLGWGKNPWIWLGVAGIGSVFSWWGAKKVENACDLALCSWAVCYLCGSSGLCSAPGIVEGTGWAGGRDSTDQGLDRRVANGTNLGKRGEKRWRPKWR